MFSSYQKNFLKGTGLILATPPPWTLKGLILMTTLQSRNHDPMCQKVSFEFSNKGTTFPSIDILLSFSLV